MHDVERRSLAEFVGPSFPQQNLLGNENSSSNFPQTVAFFLLSSQRSDWCDSWGHPFAPSFVGRFRRADLLSDHVLPPKQVLCVTGDPILGQKFPREDPFGSNHAISHNNNFNNNFFNGVTERARTSCGPWHAVKYIEYIILVFVLSRSIDAELFPFPSPQQEIQSHFSHVVASGRWKIFRDHVLV